MSRSLISSICFSSIVKTDWLIMYNSQNLELGQSEIKKYKTLGSVSVNDFQKATLPAQPSEIAKGIK